MGNPGRVDGITTGGNVEGITGGGTVVVEAAVPVGADVGDVGDVGCGVGLVPPAAVGFEGVIGGGGGGV